MLAKSLASSLTDGGLARALTASASFSAVSLPDTPIGLWYADAYQATPRKAIPNQVASAALSRNLLNAPRGLFNDNGFWARTGVTAVDGITESRVTSGLGDHLVKPSVDPTPTAGQYTMAITARRAGGTDQQFRMTMLTAGVDSGTLTATSVDQRFTLTGTLSAVSNSLIFVRTIDGATAFDIIIKDAALYAGAVDLGEPALSGHLYLGDNHFDARPTYASGVLDLVTDGAYGTVQWSSDLSLSAYTVVAVAQKTNNTRTYSNILGVPTSYDRFSAMFDNQKKADAYFAAGGPRYANFAGVSADGYNPIDAGWRFIGHSFSGTTSVLYANDTKLIYKTDSSATVPATVSSLLVGAFSAPSLTGGYKINAIALYNRALTDAEMVQAYNALYARAELSGLTLTTTSKYLVAVGDSLTVDQTTPSYAHLFTANASPRVYLAVYAQSGGSLSNLEASASVVDAVIPESGNGDYVLSVLIGTNDLTASSDVAGFLTSLASYCDARRAAGWKVALGTLLPADRVDFNARRNTANTTIRTWTGVHADVIVDFAANTTIGEDGDELNLTYYVDGVHPTLAGQTIMESIYRTAINSI